MSNNGLLFIGDKSIWTMLASQFINVHFRNVSTVIYERGDREPDLIIDWCGDWIISFKSELVLRKSILDRTQMGAINFHPAPPRYRGFGGYALSLYNRDNEYGVTCHHIVERIDYGPIIDIRTFPIFAGDTVSSLRNRAATYCLIQLYDVVDMILKDKKLLGSSNEWGQCLYTYRDMEMLKYKTYDTIKWD